MQLETNHVHVYNLFKVHLAGLNIKHTKIYVNRNQSINDKDK